MVLATQGAPAATNRLNGGQVIARVLKRHGIGTAFCLAGTAHTPSLFAMEEERIRVISGRHETGTVTAADGYARVSGKVGIAMIKADQGLPNAVTGVVAANMACSPVVVLASETPTNSLEPGAEDAHVLDLVKGHCKWVRSVPTAERLGEFLEAAIFQATTGRPGCVVLGIPQQFEAAAVDYVERAQAPATPAPVADPKSIEAAADLLAKAKRPLVIVGTGGALSGAGPELRALSKAFDLPVFGSNLGRGLVPEDMKHGFAWPLAQVSAKMADVVLVLGIRLGQRLGYGLAPRFAADAKFIQVDIQASELARNRPIDVAMVGDIAPTVAALHKALTARGVKAGGAPAWVHEGLKVRQARIDELGRETSGPIHPYRMARDLMQLMPENAIYVGDGADIQNWMHAILRIRSDRAFMDHYPSGSMGIGTPLALGAAAAAREIAETTGAPERPVVLVTGDGSFGFYCAELCGAALAGLKIVCLISNDGAWGTEKHGQMKVFKRTSNCELGQWDYQLIAQAFGLNGEKIEKAEDILPAIKRAFAANKTTVLNVLTDVEAGIVRKTDPRVQTIAFEDIVASLKTHHTPDVA